VAFDIQAQTLATIVSNDPKRGCQPSSSEAFFDEATSIAGSPALL
jgi:hypothetical protein